MSRKFYNLEKTQLFPLFSFVFITFINVFTIRICLSKWIEQGNHSCPICRKEINLNLNHNVEGGRSIWSFTFRISSIFSFLPNLSIRLVRANSGNNNLTNLH